MGAPGTPAANRLFLVDLGLGTHAPVTMVFKCFLKALDAPVMRTGLLSLQILGGGGGGVLEHVCVEGWMMRECKYQVIRWICIIRPCPSARTCNR